jgi:hypothetical protein
MRQTQSRTAEGRSIPDIERVVGNGKDSPLSDVPRNTQADIMGALWMRCCMLRRSLVLAILGLLACCDEPSETKLPSQLTTLQKFGSYDASGWHPPSGGLVADAETAIQIARIYLGPLVPADWAANSANWHVGSEDPDHWQVGLSHPSCPPRACQGGGVGVVEIRKSDGAITRIYGDQ